MSFSTTAFAVGTLIARKEKVTGAAATRAGLLMGVGGMSPVGVVLAQSSIRSARRRQRASEVGTAGGEGASPPPPTPGPTPQPTPTASGITAEDLKAGLAEGFAQFGKQMDAQNAKLLAAIAALAASIDAQTAASAPAKKSAS
ncbi:MAG: hypothetical protein WC804_11730 [Sphingomonas sp.]|jgi:hypothetical protein|uniref:hypothetical protein n=1 Tax=Sphingomonas sp. TaxID=28214 RepID=UPI0035616BF3